MHLLSYRLTRHSVSCLQEHLTKSNESIKVVMFERASPPWGFALDGYAPSH